MEGHIEKAEKFVGDGLDKAKAAALEKAEEAKKKVSCEQLQPYVNGACIQRLH